MSRTNNNDANNDAGYYGDAGDTGARPQSIYDEPGGIGPDRAAYDAQNTSVTSSNGDTNTTGSGASPHSGTSYSIVPGVNGTAAGAGGNTVASAGGAVVSAVVEPAPYAGLINPSCICYLNSLIQVLFHTPAFRSAVYQIDTERDELDETPKALQSLFYSLSTAEQGEAQSTRVLTESFGWGPRELSIQHDIQELLTKLRESLESRMRGRVNMLFSGLGEKYFRCLDGSYTSRRRDNFYDIHLPVQGQPDLNVSFDTLTATDQLVGDNKYRVEIEGKPVEYKDAETGYRFLRFAPIVLFHLKRFEMDMTSPTLETKKVNSTFSFPKVLDLSSRENGCVVTPDMVSGCTDPTLKQALEVAMEQQRLFPEVYGGSGAATASAADAASADASAAAAGSASAPIYDLYAVLIHSGGVHAGHYTCNVRAFDTDAGAFSQRWYNYDDSVVTEINEELAVDRNYGGYTWVRGHQYMSTKNAYMLAYVRRALVPRMFFKEDGSALPASVRAEFDTRVREEKRLARIEAEKNRQCHITLVTNDIIADNVARRQVDLIETGDAISKDVLQLTLPKQSTMQQLYEQVAQLLARPIDDFRLHWFVPTGSYDTHFRVGGSLLRSGADGFDTLETRAPRIVQLPERPWMFKLYVENKVAQPSHIVTNAARFATFQVSSNPAGLENAADAVPALPFVDNRTFGFDQSDPHPTVAVQLRQVHTIESVAFQTMLPKEHMPGATYACTRYDVRISVFRGDTLVHEHIAEHRRHTDHAPFHCDARFETPVRGDRVVLERIHVSLFDSYYPNQRQDPRNADALILSRLKIIVPPSELPQTPPGDGRPRFLSDDVRSFFLPVKFYSFRTARMDFCGFVSVPISEFADANMPVLRALCGLDADARIRVYEEHASDADLIEMSRRHLTVRKRDDAPEQILIVQEEPPTTTAFIYEAPFVQSFLRCFFAQRTLMLFSFKNPELGGQAFVTVPEFATHDMVCEEVGKTLRVAANRIRLYGAKESHSVQGMLVALPRAEPFRSDEANVRTMLAGRREGIVFYDVLKTSLKEAESVVQVECHYADEHGVRAAPEQPFKSAVNIAMSMQELAEQILEHFGRPFDRPHVFMDIQASMLENYSVVLPPARADVAGGGSGAGGPAGAGGGPAGGGGGGGGAAGGLSSSSSMQGAAVGGGVTNSAQRTVEKFFRSLENRAFELRPFPEADSMSQVYTVVHGEYHPHGYPSVVLRANSTPTFLSVPLATDAGEAYQLVKDHFKMTDDDFSRDPKQHEIMLYIHVPLHFPNWSLKLKDYFFFNPTQLSRPKAMLINHKHEKEKPGSRYVPVNQPALNLNKRKTEGQPAGAGAGAGAGASVPGAPSSDALDGRSRSPHSS
jgi:hypothetical protein